jgi:hypothetical protein
VTKERAEKAISIAMVYGMFDGAHHKQWVIDQMLRELMGDKLYKKMVSESDEWDCGIAP